MSEVMYATKSKAKNHGVVCMQATTLGIPVSEGDFDLVNQINAASAVPAWRLQGLPDDRFSTENAIIVSHSQRWPLLIDPQASVPRHCQILRSSWKILRK